VAMTRSGSKRAHVLVHNTLFRLRVFASSTHMDIWRIALLGDGGVGKTALAVQVSEPYLAFPQWLILGSSPLTPLWVSTRIFTRVPVSDT
jgi:hypothetical protein